MEPALEAILGHKSAHSLATGPVMAEPRKGENKLSVKKDHSHICRWPCKS